MAKAEREKQERQERREKFVLLAVRKKLHDAWRARDEKDEAELELELMRIGVETRGDRPKDWSSSPESCRDVTRLGGPRAKTEGLHGECGEVVWSVDNAFAVFDLLMEWFTFSSLGLKGAAGVAWGLEGAASSRSEAATTSSQIAPRRAS